METSVSEQVPLENAKCHAFCIPADFRETIHSWTRLNTRHKRQFTMTVWFIQAVALYHVGEQWKCPIVKNNRMSGWIGHFYCAKIGVISIAA
ncbi:MAG: hypothetical protein LBC27_06400 [Spirochaetaceae bacterium]|nr:hypothetical protein [Spirochaetaceae bacterium]